MQHPSIHVFKETTKTMRIDRNNLWSVMYILAVIVLVATTTECVKLCENKCKGGQSCMPTDQQWTDFAATLDGHFLSRTSDSFNTEKKMWNGRVNKNPIGIVMVANAADVQKSLALAKEHNLAVSIRSSGHSFIGRSVEDDSLLLSLENMQSIQVNTTATTRSAFGEVTVESGCTWAKVYEELDQHDRVVVGGSAHTVAMGGYTQGGGHSPLSRSLGLAVDNLLEAEIVTADGKWLVVSKTGTVDKDNGTTTDDTDLFWALRGGGGGTWGVVISFTFKLHEQPSQLVQFIGLFPFYYDGELEGVNTLRRILPVIENLPKEWGGYVVAGPHSEDPRSTGGFIVSLLHFGPWSKKDSLDAIWPLYFDPSTSLKWFQNKTSFWDYERNVTDADSRDYRTYILNTLVQPGMSNSDLPEIVREELFSDLAIATTQCTFVSLGQKTNNPDVDSKDVPVNPGFRSASFSLTCARTWDNTIVDDANIGLANRFSCRLQDFGRGMYFNEPTEQLSWWKTAFWGSMETYNKLLTIKRRVDPENMFCCHNCVGFDIDPDADPEDDPIVQSKPCSGTMPSGTTSLIVSLLAALILLNLLNDMKADTI